MAARLSPTGWNDRDAIIANLEAAGLVRTLLFCPACGTAQGAWDEPGSVPERPCLTCDGPTRPWAGEPTRRLVRPPKAHPEPL